MAQLQSTSITGSLIVTQGITGSFSGSISNATSASYAATASYALNAGDSVWTGSAGNIYYNGGNVGIGTASPATKLQVNGTFASNALWTDASSIAYWGSYSTAYGGLTWDTGYAMVFSAGGAALRFGTNGTSVRMTIDTSGNVGIGTTNPSQKFVVSNGSSEVFKVYSSGEVVAGTNYIYAAYSSGTSFYSQGPASFRDGIHNDTSTYLKIDGGTSGFTYFSGNVGIGTTNPAAKLYVVGSSQNTLALDSPAYPELTFRVSGTVKSYDAIVTTNQGYFNTSTVGDRIYRTEAGNHLFGYSTTEIMRIASGGNVGIGTANPTEKLHVIGNTIIQATSTGNGTTAVRVNNSAGTQVLAIGAAGEIIMNNSSKISTIVDPTSTQPQLELYNAGTGYTTLQSSTSYGLLLNPNGSNVGIGTTNPAYKLDVFGIDDTTPEIRIGNSSGKTAFIGFSSTYGFDVDAGGVGGNYLNLKGGANGSTGGITFSTFALERMRIDYTGNVGIGTTNPARKLSIVDGAGPQLRLSDGTANTFWEFYSVFYQTNQDLIIQNQNLAAVTINSVGNVGIGATIPSYKLQVESSTNANIAITAASGYQTALELKGTDRWYRLISQPTAGNGGRFDIYDQTGGAYRLSINTDGNVGIGNTAPAFKLDVNGTVRFSAEAYIAGVWSTSYGPRNSGDPIKFVDWNATELVRINTTNGNVGIGTTSPSAKFQVTDTSSSITLQNYLNGAAIFLDGVNGDFIGGDYFHILADGSSYLGVGGYAGGATPLNVSNNGNVGIGTTNPYSKLEITSTTPAWGEGIIINPASSGYASVFYRLEGTSGSTYTGTWALGKAYSGDSGGEVLQVVKNGLTGGTGYRVDALQQWKTNGDSIFGFKVGIGTTNPTVPLQVNGAGGDTTPILRIIGSAAQTFNWASTTEHASLTAGQTSIHLIGKANSQYNQAYFGYRHVSDGSSSNMVTIGMYASDYLLNILGNGNVGIGTTTPSQKLVVNGRAIVGGGLTGDALSISTSIGTYTFNGYDLLTPSSFLITAGSSGYLSLDGYPVIFKVSGGEKMRVNTDGNVGIGTSTPAGKLSISTPNAYEGTILQLQSRDEPTAYNLKINEVVTSGVVRWSFDMTNSSAYNNVLVFDRGNIGIGTTSPYGKFQVNASNYGESPTINKALLVSDSAAPSKYLILTYHATPDIGIIQGLHEGTAWKNIALNPNGGNVGIGTTSIGYKLYVNGTSYFADTIYNGGGYISWTAGYSDGTTQSYNGNSLAFLTNSSSYTVRMFITSGGNIGIGTTAPLFNLQVGANSGTLATTTIRLQNSYLDTNGYYGFNIDAVDNGVNGHDLRFLGRTTPTGGFSELVRIKNGGNVGIGTTSPSDKLSVVGNVSVTSGDYRIYNGSTILSSTSTSLLEINAGGFSNVSITNGNVGIGTTSPVFKLDVNGNTRIGGNSGSNTARLNVGGVANEWVADFQASSTTNQSYGLVVRAGTSSTDFPFYVLNSSSANAFFAIKGNGNIGIGTTSPIAKLNIASDGNTQFTLTRTNASNSQQFNINVESDSQASISYDSNSPLVIGTSTNPGTQAGFTERMRITSAGNVGIGTTSPAQKLDVIGTIRSQVTSPGAGNGDVYAFAVHEYNGNNGRMGLGLHDTGDAFLGLYSDTGVTTRIDSNGSSYFMGGNVGIGTTSPSTKLHLYEAGASDVIFRITPADGSYDPLIQLTGQGNSISSEGFEVWYANSVGDVHLSTTYPNSAAAIRFHTATGASKSTSNERMTITGDGNVGIGTTSPSAKLHVQTSSTNLGLRLGNTNGTNWDFYSYNDSNLYINNSLGTVFTIHNSNGNVGIGTASPAFPLHVARSSGDSVIVADSGTSSNSQFRFQEAGSLTAAITFVSSDDSLRFYNGGDRFTILSSGNIGIGTTSPAALLHVSQPSANTVFRLGNNTTYDQFIYFNGSNDWSMGMDYSNSNAFVLSNYSSLGTNDRLVVTTGGNVGIGTTSPQNILHVLGSASTPTTSANNGIFTIQATNGVQLSTGVVNASPYGVFLQTKDQNNAGPYNYPLLLNPTNGNVGIGTTSPNALLHVAGTIHSFPSTTDGILQASQAGSSGGLTTVVIRSNGVSYFNGGNVGIGVTAPAAKLQVSGSTNVLNVRGSGSAVTSSIFSVDGNNGRLFEVSDDLSNSLFSVNTIAGLPVIEAFADYTVTMGTYGAYSLQVTGSRVGVGTSSPGYPLHVSGSVSGISIYATNDIAAFSDQSVKTDLQVIDSAVDRIKQINGYTYVRVDDLSNTRRAGVIAQEVQKVLPEVVSENSDGTLNVAYSNMIALLIEGMKEQQAQIDKLREDLEDLRYEL